MTSTDFTPLVRCCSNSHFSCFQSTLKQEFDDVQDPNVEDDFGLTALHCAAKKGDRKAQKELTHGVNCFSMMPRYFCFRSTTLDSNVGTDRGAASSSWRSSQCVRGELERSDADCAAAQWIMNWHQAKCHCTMRASQSPSSLWFGGRHGQLFPPTSRYGHAKIAKMLLMPRANFIAEWHQEVIKIK